MKFNDELEFKPWPKIPRPKGNNIIITEKMDGTNACVIVKEGEVVGVQSRKRFITVEDDNYGFAKFVENNKEAFIKLGDGYHYGEWCGEGIQRNPHKLDGKYFYLFNPHIPCEYVPAPLRRVEVLYTGPSSEEVINKCYNNLWKEATGKGYQPEGVIVFYYATGGYVKHTYANQDGKWVDGSS